MAGTKGSQPSAQPKASPDLLVIHTDRAGGDVGRTLAGLGTIEELKGRDGLLLLLLRAEAKSGDAKAMWQRVRKLLGAGGSVQPVLVDERGGEQYPTGEIVVRFTTSPSDKELERFAKAHRLRVGQRNEYVPHQVTFAPLDPGTQYIPDAIEAISGAKDVHQAWANTLTRYERA